MIQNHITLNPWSKQPNVVLAVQGESQAREIIATLIDASGAPINLTDKTARMYIEKTDKTTVFFDGVTQDTLNGVVSFTLPLQATTSPGSANKGQIIVNDASGATLVSYGLQLDVVASRFNGILESTSEFTALQEALATVQDIDSRVPKDTTIAGIDLQNPILLSELISAGLAAGGAGGAALNALALGGVGAANYAQVSSGTWTPIFQAGSQILTDIGADAFFYKVGKLVFINLGANSNTAITDTGAISVSGLPFAVKSVGATCNIYAMTANKPIMGRALETEIQFFVNGNVRATKADLEKISYLRLGLTYETT